MSLPKTKYTSKLSSRLILIFGASSGLGFAVAEACLEHDATVILSGSSAPRLASAVARLRASDPQLSSARIITHACDLSDKANLERSLRRLFEVVTASAGAKVDHIVFTAGDARRMGGLEGVSVEGFEAEQVVRNVAPVMVAKFVREFCVGGPGCSYTLTSGFIAAKPPPGFGLWAASGVEGLGRGLAVELAPVRVNVVAPGVVRTEAMDKVPEQVLEMMAKATTTGRLGRPEDVAEAYLYCMKDGYVTGSVIQTNGGRLLV